jgi:hypothetical protein
MADQAEGGQGNFIDHAKCIPGGMPSMMSAPAQELYRHTGNHLYLGWHRSSSHFHRWSPLAHERGADLSGIFDRQMDRRRRRRCLRRARS